MWGHLANQEPSPRDGPRPGEARGPHSGQRAVCPLVPTGSTTSAQEGGSATLGWDSGDQSPWAAWLQGLERGTEWVPAGAWLLRVSLRHLWLPGAEQGAFPCVWP